MIEIYTTSRNPTSTYPPHTHRHFKEYDMVTGVVVVLLHKPLIAINHVPYDTLKSLKTRLENSSMNEIKARLQVSEYVEVAGTC